MNKKSLEITCYVAGAGAFGVFFRWLQDQLAFNEAGLNERSALNLIVPAVVIASALMFYRFVSAWKEQHYCSPKDFCHALYNPGRLFAIARWAAGLVMIVGAAVLLMSTEADPLAYWIRVLCLLAFLSGLAFPFVLGQANYEYLANETLVRIGMMAPVLMYALWLVLNYRQNAFNSVPWSYAMEIAAIIAAMLGFFRAAGFAFRMPDGHRALFATMLGGALCIMALADERYMGMQPILLASAGMQLLYVWILVRNLEKRTEKKQHDPEVEEGGFEKLD